MSQRHRAECCVVCVCGTSDGPRISCDATSAFVGDRDVYLCCQVRSRPPPLALYWVLDDDADNSTTRIGHGAGQYGDGQDYWTVATVSSCSLTLSLSLTATIFHLKHCIHCSLRIQRSVLFDSQNLSHVHATRRQQYVRGLILYAEPM